jgi:hypothetical protein
MIPGEQGRRAVGIRLRLLKIAEAKWTYMIRDPGYCSSSSSSNKVIPNLPRSYESSHSTTEEQPSRGHGVGCAMAGLELSGIFIDGGMSSRDRRLAES